MIYYFSGTGNTRWVAEQVSRACGLALRNVADCLGDVATPEINLWTEGILGLAFPIYGWTIPKVAEAFIRSLPRAEVPGTYYVFALLICGDDIGRAHEHLAMLLAEKGYELSAVWSFSMPNTYIGLPFFDVDNEELAARKIKSTQEKLPRVAQQILCREKGVVDVVPGSFSRWKSGWLRQFFYRFWVGPKMFSTRHRCTACKRCEKVCPLHNIKVERPETGPKWGQQCTFCLACYHVCPISNILVGPSRTCKGRYTHFLEATT